MLMKPFQVDPGLEFTCDRLPGRTFRRVRRNSDAVSLDVWAVDESNWELVCFPGNVTVEVAECEKSY